MGDLLVSAIIPAHNEQNTIADVVRVLRSSNIIDETIVVSDGSEDATAQVAKDAGAIVYELQNRSGKGAAMKHGVAQANARVIAFFDADLIGLTKEHVEQIVMPVKTGAKAMQVGIRDRGRFWTSVSMHLPLIGGERAMRREIFNVVPYKYLQGYMVESALNYYCRVNKLPYGAVKLDGLIIRRKYEKVGLLLATVQYIKMFAQIAKAMAFVRLAHLFGKF